MATDIKTEAEALVREASLNLSEKDFDSAERNLRAAIDLYPVLAEAHRWLGRTLSYEAARLKEDPARKNQLLDEAERLIRRSTELAGESASNLHDLAWIYDERGTANDLKRAVELYRRALEGSSRTESPENDLTPIHYNLACALTKLGADHYAEAIDALAPVFADPWRGDVWQFAERDPDFEPLRQSEQWGERFRQLVITSRKRSIDSGRTS